jgi:hypothetical protein
LHGGVPRRVSARCACHVSFLFLGRVHSTQTSFFFSSRSVRAGAGERRRSIIVCFSSPAHARSFLAFHSVSFFLSLFPHHTCSLIISPVFQNLHSSHLPRCPTTPFPPPLWAAHSLHAGVHVFLAYLCARFLYCTPVFLPRYLFLFLTPSLPSSLPSQSFGVLVLSTLRSFITVSCTRSHPSVIACRPSPRSLLSY